MNVDGSFPRFEEPVCPGVTGLPLSMALAVVDRLREDIRSVGALLAPENCDPNLTLIITIDGGRLIGGLAAKSPPLFRGMDAHAIDSLARAKGPAWTWRTTDPKRADGAPVQAISAIALPGEPPRPVAKGAYMANNATMSRLGASVRRDTSLAFVVLSADAIEGLTIQQIADYAALRGLAPVSALSRPTSGPTSIVALFDALPDDANKLPSLTAFDRAFLEGLYRGTNGLTFAQKTKQIAQHIAHALSGKED